MKSFARRAPAAPDPLEGFGEEAPVVAPRSVWRPIAIAALGVVIAGVAAIPYAMQRYSRVPALSILTIDSSPSGRQLVVDGVPRGVTPATITLAHGDHVVLIGEGDKTVTLPVTTRPGEQLRQSVVFEATVGSVVAHAAPIPAQPSAVPAAASADNRPSAPAQASKGGGWIAVTAAIPIKIYEKGVLLGSSESPRLMLPSGSHALELRNDDLGFRATRSVEVAEGKTLAFALTLPRSVLHVNAVPWAEVSIDGVKVGETPIGNYALSIGTHQVVFTHPQFGERRQSVAVTAGAPARVSVDFTK